MLNNYYTPYGYNTYYPNQNLQYNRPAILPGKVVESLDVVKAIDIPLDGNTSYFPLADGSAIVSKQLQLDGTSKVIIYKPVVDEPEKEVKYVTENDLEIIKKEIEDLKKQLTTKVGE